jgi:tRNA-2-methylthio-N6-dimethylallyladenosine synthase
MKYFVKTFGCQMNESDSERIASFLEKQGHRKSEKMEDADLIVVNACSVRQTAIDRIFGLNKKFKSLKAKKILTGCLIKSDIPKFKVFFDEVKDINQFLGKEYLSIEPKCQIQSPAHLPIMTGCDNFCSYCVVPYTRGREISRPMNEIVKEFKNFLKKGYKEIILLGQNVNSYKYGFAKLLRKLNSLPGEFKIKFMTNHPKDVSSELIDAIAECKKVEKEIHLPVQSGDNTILKKMNRKYTVQEYEKLVGKIRKKIPDVKITTDVIVGFPSETKKQFQNTVKLFQKIKFDLAYINKYSQREGTAAAKFKDNVSWQEKKRRWETLNKLVNSPQKPKLIVILGPTASGKSALAVELALRLRSGQAQKLGIIGGEIVSADSRQIYKGMNIGTGKISPDTKNSSNFSTGQAEKKHVFIHEGISHYMIDITSPRKQFSVAEYRNLALDAIEKIYAKGKIPIICGGTGFYIRAIVDGLIIPEVEPDWRLRKELEKKSTEDLFKELKKLDPNRVKNIDVKNRRRLIRAIEIIKKTGKPVPALEKQPKFNVLYIGIKKSLPEIKKSIDKRIDKMIKAGLEKEVRNLVKKYGWTLVLKNTIGYSSFAKATEDESEIINDVKLQTYQFAKRQLTWFKKCPGDKVHWILNQKEAEKLTEKFLN